MVQFLGPTLLTQKKPRAFLCSRILTFAHLTAFYAFWMFSFVLKAGLLNASASHPTSAAQRLPQFVLELRDPNNDLFQ